MYVRFFFAARKAQHEDYDFCIYWKPDMPDKKNPTAVQIGQRIKQARKMAGFETASKLLKELPDWGSGRLGNYEAGISLPAPDDVKLIARITGASPCWIMFGLGPIRATGRDIQAIRHQNFAYVYETCKAKSGALQPLLKALGISRNKAQNYIDNPFKTLPEKMMRLCERYQKKPTGWMDEQHVESDPLCAAFPEDMRLLMEIFSNLDAEKRQLFIKIAKAFSDPT